MLSCIILVYRLVSKCLLWTCSDEHSRLPAQTSPCRSRSRIKDTTETWSSLVPRSRRCNLFHLHIERESQAIKTGWVEENTRYHKMRIKIYNHDANITFLIFYKFPECYYFPPFFTIQPVLSTREKQLQQWRQLILSYYTFYKIKTLVVHDCALWKNSKINRSLNSDGIRIIMRDFIRR